MALLIQQGLHFLLRGFRGKLSLENLTALGALDLGSSGGDFLIRKIVAGLAIRTGEDHS